MWIKIVTPWATSPLTKQVLIVEENVPWMDGEMDVLNQPGCLSLSHALTLGTGQKITPDTSIKHLDAPGAQGISNSETGRLLEQYTSNLQFDTCPFQSFINVFPWNCLKSESCVLFVTMSRHFGILGSTCFCRHQI